MRFLLVLPSVLLLLLLLLLLVSSSFSPAFHVVPFVHGALPPPTVSGSVNTIFLATFQQAIYAYQLENPTFKALPLKLNSGFPGGYADATSGLYDFTVTTSSMPDSGVSANPTLKSYPIGLVALAPYYNLPSSAGTTPLTLTSETMCRMWRRDITHWNHSAIQATNPQLVLPFVPIAIVQLNFSNDASLGASRLCTKVDPGWASTYGISSWPPIPGVVQITLAQGSAGIGSYVLDHPWSIGFSSPVAALEVPKARLINQAQKIVAPGPETASQAFLELAPNGILPGGNGFDLSNPQSAFAWPTNIAAWVFIDALKVRSTCTTKAAALKFLLWFYTSSVAHQLAENAFIAVPPQQYLDQSGLLATLRKEILCDGGTSLVEQDSASAQIRGNPMMRSTLTFLTEIYAQVDSTYTYGFAPMADSLALDRISTGEIDFAMVSTDALQDEQIDLFLAPIVDPITGESIDGGILLPAFLVGVVPTFSLPVNVTTLWGKRTVSNSLGALPSLYPLTIDLETLALIFTGEITGWLDQRMLDLNPQLEPWFRLSFADRRLYAVICCSNLADPLVSTTTLMPYLLKTQAFKDALGASIVSTLTAQTMWSTLNTAAPVATRSMVDRESTVYAKLLMQPGSVSYKQMASPTFTQTTDFQLMVKPSAAAAAYTVKPTPASMSACMALRVQQPSFLRDYLSNPKQRDWTNTDTGCYPLMRLASLAVGRAFKSASQAALTGTVITLDPSRGGASHQSACVRAQKNLELLRWMQTSEVLQTAAQASGVVRLADFPAIRSYVVNEQLEHATCDGDTILITLPLVWSTAKAALVFATVAFVITAILVVVTCGLLWRYRMHPSIRGASPFFLAQVAIGAAMLVASLLPWASAVSNNSCMAFQWLVNLGFTLLFSPLFAKTWRIYQIFSAKKIRVVKITDRRLAIVVAGMLAVELVLLAVWSGVSPLQPVLIERPTSQVDGAVSHTTHCAMADGAGSVLLGLEAAFKSLLLLFGCVMGFSTRKVTASFNESSSVAWSVYNALFSGLIVGAILVFLDTVGDTLIWLVLFLLLWIALGTWALVFLPKFATIASNRKEFDAGGLSTSLASLSNRDGSITFASVSAFSVAQLVHYKAALETQLEKVRRALVHRGGTGSKAAEAALVNMHAAGEKPSYAMVQLRNSDGSDGAALSHSAAGMLRRRGAGGGDGGSTASPLQAQPPRNHLSITLAPADGKAIPPNVGSSTPTATSPTAALRIITAPAGNETNMAKARQPMFMQQQQQYASPSATGHGRTLSVETLRQRQGQPTSPVLQNRAAAQLPTIPLPGEPVVAETQQQQQHAHQQQLNGADPSSVSDAPAVARQPSSSSSISAQPGVSSQPASPVGRAEKLSDGGLLVRAHSTSDNQQQQQQQQQRVSPPLHSQHLLSVTSAAPGGSQAGSEAGSPVSQQHQMVSAAAAAAAITPLPAAALVQQQHVHAHAQQQTSSRSVTVQNPKPSSRAQPN